MIYDGKFYREALAGDYLRVISQGALGLGTRSKRSIAARTFFIVGGDWVSPEWIERADDDRSWTAPDGRCLRMTDRLQYVNHSENPNLIAVWEEKLLVNLNQERIEADEDLFTDYGEGGPTKSRGNFDALSSAIEHSFEAVARVIEQRVRRQIKEHHVLRPNGTTDWVSILDRGALRSAVADYEGTTPVADMPVVPDMTAFHTTNHGNYKHAREHRQPQGDDDLRRGAPRARVAARSQDGAARPAPAGASATRPAAGDSAGRSSTNGSFVGQRSVSEPARAAAGAQPVRLRPAGGPWIHAVKGKENKFVVELSAGAERLRYYVHGGALPDHVGSATWEAVLGRRISFERYEYCVVPGACLPLSVQLALQKLSQDDTNAKTAHAAMLAARSDAQQAVNLHIPCPDKGCTDGPGWMVTKGPTTRSYPMVCRSSTCPSRNQSVLQQVPAIGKPSDGYFVDSDFIKVAYVEVDRRATKEVDEQAKCLRCQVRKTPSWPRSWANFSLL
jgi:hypothetical protein